MRNHLADFLECVEHYGLSPDKPGDGWKLAVALFMDYVRVKRVGAKRKRGRRPSDDALIEDIIILASVTIAKERGDPSSEADIIRDLEKANGWPTRSIKTRLRRLHYLKDKASPSYQRLAKRVCEEVEAGRWPISPSEKQI